MTPRATYRLQFRDGTTFDRAAELVPYLADLGVSHLYASPVFTAAPDSTHGYDVADHQELDPQLGGEEGFALLAGTLKNHGLGLILDIVPNHMAVSTANPWWKDVLEHGSASRYAGHFDIDWNAPKLLLPVLGEPYAEALSEGKLELRLDAETGEPSFCYYDLALPLAPHSLSILLAQSHDLRQAVEQASADHALLHEIHEAQVWRLAYWRLAREALTYRRFFEIAELIGVRVEDEKVFADVHRLPLRLVKDGAVDGLRIDHIDGLADPKAYLDQLNAASGLDYVVVEKILGPGEDLRGDWRCAGTTGYEVGQLITGLFVDGANGNDMTEAWVNFTAEDPDFAKQVIEAKRRIITVNLAGELEGLVRLAQRVALADVASRDFGRDALRRVLIEMAAAMPVYRTYIGDGVAEADRAIIAEAVGHVDFGREVEDGLIITFIASLLLDPPGGSVDRAAFIRRFQQTTGPLTAKAVEDTVFYRYNRLIALNEVGAEPAEFGVEPQAFHAAMERRASDWPRAMSATATHDTKRGEDARARLAVLSEMPRDWADAVSRWHDATYELREELPRGPAPGPRGEWLFYQALAGAWPPELDLSDEAGLADLSERLVSFMTKALREAKRRTSWTDQNEPFEAAVENYVRALFAPERRELLRDIRATVAAIEPAGMVNSLAQLALKLTVPGVPDIYQGCELPDFSMVDPDNRRPVDFELHRRLLQEARQLTAIEAMARWREGLPKLWLLDRLLDLRQKNSPLFEQGSYQAIEAGGEHAGNVVAFARSFGDQHIVVAVPRLVLRHVDKQRPSWISAGSLADTRLRLPFEASRYRTITGSSLPGESNEIAISKLWNEFPVAILWSKND